jgi:hypothetical protein
MRASAGEEKHELTDACSSPVPHRTSTSRLSTARLLRLPGDAEGGEAPTADLARTSGESVPLPRSSQALALLVDLTGTLTNAAA